MEETAKTYTPAVGRRKTASAQVRLYFGGKGEMTVNKKSLKEYFPTELLRQEVMAPFVTTGTEGRYDVTVRVQGGGIHGQATAVRHGIARCLLANNPEFRAALKKQGFLTRDARKRERKKYGKKSARRSPQWSKR